MLIRLCAADTQPEQVTRLGALLREVPGSCAVTLVFEMPSGAEVHLAAAADIRVEAGDRLFAALERQFGRQVAELR